MTRSVLDHLVPFYILVKTKDKTPSGVHVEEKSDLLWHFIAICSSPARALGLVQDTLEILPQDKAETEFKVRMAEPRMVAPDFTATSEAVYRI